MLGGRGLGGYSWSSVIADTTALELSTQLAPFALSSHDPLTLATANASSRYNEASGI